MSFLVTDEGITPVSASEDTAVLDIQSDMTADVVEGLAAQLDALELIRIHFPTLADGRGFTLARSLRLLGYQGRLRACGQVIADQYAMARRCGFDEVEISAALAARQPEMQWQAELERMADPYQPRLGFRQGADCPV
jgi:uncharacterized protein (DUF934 family)